MPDPIAPPTAGRPVEAVEVVSLAVSDGDLEAALAQYEAGQCCSLGQVTRAGIRVPSRTPDRPDGPAASAVCLDPRVVPGDGLALIAGERHMAGTRPDRERIQLSGAGATVVGRQQDGS